MDFTLILPALLGLAAGLLVNYLADVLPVTRRLSQPACPNCQTATKAKPRRRRTLRP